VYELREWLLHTIAELSTSPPSAIDPRERFHRYGLDSLGAAKLTAILSQKLGRALSPTIFWEYPTIDELAKHLSNDSMTTSLESAAAITEVRLQRDEPIAIVGMACRFPGANNPASFWHLLENGVDAVREAPGGRWSTEMAQLDLSAEEKRRLRRASWLERIDEFDSFFFGISPREARSMDPQQRLVLELCWDALEDAGIRADELVGSKTGVFAAAIWSDYAQLQLRAGVKGIKQHSVTGAHRSIFAHRVS
jgi:acyl carrier protein